MKKINRHLVAVLVCVVGLIVLPRPALQAGANTVFFTGFEASEGYSSSVDLIGQNGWIGSGSGGNGLVTEFFPGEGQQAYVGFAPPNPGDDLLSVWRPINLAPVPTNQPIVRFSVLMEVMDSTNGEYDDFYWSVYNTQGQRLFTLDFDNFSTLIYYALDGTNAFVSTGQHFTNGTVYPLSLTMDFSQNRWSAALGNTTLVTNQPITTVGAALDLGDIDAVWAVFNADAPGDNFMLFDNYRVTTEAAVPAPSQLRLLGVTPDGQALLRLTGQDGCAYAIDASTNLVDWTALRTNVATGGMFDYIDTGAAAFSSRFYRGRLVP